MGTLDNGRPTECILCEYVVPVGGEAITLSDLVELLEGMPPDTPLTFDFGGHPAFNLGGSAALAELDPSGVALAFPAQMPSPVTGQMDAPPMVRDHLDRLREMMDADPNLSALPIRGGQVPRRPYHFINTFEVTEVTSGVMETHLVLADWEGREPVCPNCDFCGRWGPGQMVLVELHERLVDYPRDLPVVTDQGETPVGLNGFWDRNTQLPIRRHLSISCFPLNPRVAHPQGFTVIQLAKDLEYAWDAALEYRKGETTVTTEGSPVWCEDRMLVGTQVRNGKVVLNTSDQRWVNRSH